jgi:hypothetical protein
VDEDVTRLLYPLAQMFAGGLAWTHGARHPEHRVVGLLFTWQLAADLARMAIAPTLDAYPWPYGGGTLVLYYLDHALELSVRFTMVAAVWAHFGRWSVAPVLSAYVTCVAGLVVYKVATDASLVPVHQLLAALTATTCVGVALARVLGPRERLPLPDGAHAALLLLIATDATNALAHASHSLEAWWPALRVADMAAVTTIAAGYAVVLGKEALGRWRRA